MDQHTEKKISKTLSYVLRHKPDAIGLQLDDSGWAVTNELLEKLNQTGTVVNLGDLKYVVENNNKKRFAFNEDFSRIRANQGHSLDVDLQLVKQKPPETLYHGTARKNLETIQQSGLLKMNRQHVHLSFSKATAVQVGQRHGKPIVLEIMAGTMHSKGYVFYLSDNGVWLTDNVPTEFIVFR